VGVAGDVHNISLATPPQAEVYLPLPQRPWATMCVILKTAGEPHHWASAARAAVAAVDPGQPVTQVASMDEVLDDATGQQRFGVFLLGVFSGTALLLAAVGLYGTMAYSVADRTREMGVRIALGAVRGDIYRMVIGQGLLLALIGVIIGANFALVFGRLMASSGLLFEVSAYDPVSFVVSAAVFVTIGVVASYLPARRATRVDPMEALRWE